MDDLAREDLLRRVAAALGVVGIVAVAPGVLCVFWRAGLVLLALGAPILAASFLVPESEDEA